MNTSSKEYKIMFLEDNINKLANSDKNIKCGGVLRKRRRQLRNLKNNL